MIIKKDEWPNKGHKACLDFISVLCVLPKNIP